MVSGDGLLVVLDQSVYVIGTEAPDRCLDFDADCIGIEREGYAVHCWKHDRSRGVCPFVGN
jgi:hypothetical protein